MAITLTTYANGMTDYVSRMNADNRLLEQVISALQTKVGSGGTASTGSSANPNLEALFGSTSSVIGAESYKVTANADTHSVDVAGGYYWHAANNAVYKSATIYNFDLTGQTAGTKYIGVQATGIPALQTTSTGAIYSIGWNGTIVGTITLLAPVAWGFNSFDAAKHNAAIGLDTLELDDMLEAIAGANFTPLDVTIEDSDVTVTSIQAVSHGVLSISGTMDANHNLFLPNLRRPYVVDCSVAGGFTVTIKTVAGSGIGVVAGDRAVIYSDGTNIVLVAKGTGTAPPGTVTSVAIAVPGEFTVAGSPITGSGTFTIGKNDQLPNKIWAGPASPSAAAAPPTFRTLAIDDIPDLSSLYITFANGEGTVTSVALAMPSEFAVTNSPVTTSGTLTVGKVNQNAHFVYAGPTSGGAAAPGFRALVISDIPDLSSLYGTGNGTVTSVALSAPAEFSVAGSPVTGSGTLTLAKVNQSQNHVYAGPSSGGAGAPGFRALVQSDLPAQPYVIAGDMGDSPTPLNNSQSIIRHIPTDNISLPSGLSGSVVKARSAATAAAAITIKKNGASVGTATFGVGSTTATLSFTSAVTFTAATDEFELVGPASADATLAGLYWSFRGTR